MRVVGKARGAVAEGNGAVLQHVAAVHRAQAFAHVLLGDQDRDGGLQSRQGLEDLAHDGRLEPSEGSSRMSRRGLAMRARAMATIRCCPPDIVPASWR